MNRSTALLAALLAVQIGAAAALALRGPDHAAFKAQEPLLAFERDRIDEITISETGGASVTLRKDGESWIVPALADFPADAGKVQDLLGRLAGLRKGWPVATTAGAAGRFKVADDAHERRIVLGSGGKAAGTILFGTSPGFRRVHARSGGDADIFNVEFATYEAATRGEDWMDRSLLAIPEEKIARISLADVTLERKDGRFVVAGLAGTEKMKEDAVARLVAAVSRPAVETVLGKGGEALARLEPPDVQVTIGLADGSTVTGRYRKEAEGGAYLFATSAQAHLFRMAAASAEAVVNARRDTLIEAPGGNAETQDRDGNAEGRDKETEGQDKSAGEQKEDAAQDQDKSAGDGQQGAEQDRREGEGSP